jgi:hypothetical protein
MFQQNRTRHPSNIDAAMKVALIPTQQGVFGLR